MGRFTKRVNVRIAGLDESVSREELIAAVSSKGRYLPVDLRLAKLRGCGGALGRCTWLY